MITTDDMRRAFIRELRTTTVRQIKGSAGNFENNERCAMGVFLDVLGRHGMATNKGFWAMTGAGFAMQGEVFASGRTPISPYSGHPGLTTLLGHDKESQFQSLLAFSWARGVHTGMVMYANDVLGYTFAQIAEWLERAWRLEPEITPANVTLVIQPEREVSYV